MTTLIHGGVGGHVRVTSFPRPTAGFDAFFEETWPDLVAFCHTLTGDANAAEELSQEALVRTYARFPTLREPRPYAFRVASNLVRARWRQLQRPVPGMLHDQSPPTNVRTEVVDAVQRLPERLRAVVLLHYFADLPVEDVARQLRRPTGTIKRRLHEARQQLATALGDAL